MGEDISRSVKLLQYKSCENQATPGGKSQKDGRKIASGPTAPEIFQEGEGKKTNSPLGPKEKKFVP